VSRDDSLEAIVLNRLGSEGPDITHGLETPACPWEPNPVSICKPFSLTPPIGGVITRYE
jgi:hypothetical protein